MQCRMVIRKSSELGHIRSDRVHQRSFVKHRTQQRCRLDYIKFSENQKLPHEKRNEIDRCTGLYRQQLGIQ